MKITALIVLVVLVTTSAPARACDTEKTAKPESDCVVMARGAARGVWFELTLADELRSGQRALQELTYQARTYQAALGIRDYQLSAMRDALEAEREAKGQALLQADAQGQDARRARQERDDAVQSRSAWYRSPLLWTGVGLVVGVVGGVALTSSF